MAYMDVRPHELVWGPHVAARAAGPAAPLLQRIERDVLLASRRDRLTSLDARGPLGRWAGRLFGTAAPNRLADPRLEALRRYAVMLRRRGGRLPVAEQARIAAAGFSTRQTDEIRRLVLGDRPARRATWRRRTTAMIALVFAVEAAVFRLASAYFSDGLVGLMVTLTTLVASTPLIGLLRRGPAPAGR